MPRITSINTGLVNLVHGALHMWLGIPPVGRRHRVEAVHLSAAVMGPPKKAGQPVVAWSSKEPNSGRSPLARDSSATPPEPCPHLRGALGRHAPWAVFTDIPPEELNGVYSGYLRAKSEVSSCIRHPGNRLRLHLWCAQRRDTSRRPMYPDLEPIERRTLDLPVVVPPGPIPRRRSPQNQRASC